MVIIVADVLSLVGSGLGVTVAASLGDLCLERLHWQFAASELFLGVQVRRRMVHFRD